MSTSKRTATSPRSDGTMTIPSFSQIVLLFVDADGGSGSGRGHGRDILIRP